MLLANWFNIFPEEEYIRLIRKVYSLNRKYKYKKDTILRQFSSHALFYLKNRNIKLVLVLVNQAMVQLKQAIFLKD